MLEPDGSSQYLAHDVPIVEGRLLRNTPRVPAVRGRELRNKRRPATGLKYPAASHRDCDRARPMSERYR